MHATEEDIGSLESDNDDDVFGRLDLETNLFANEI